LGPDTDVRGRNAASEQALGREAEESSAVNPRKRRAILLLALSAMGLIAVFVLVAGYVSDVRSEVDPKVELLALAKPIEANQPIGDDMVKTVVVPEHFAPKAALRNRADLIGLVAASKLPAEAILQEGMLVSPPQLSPGQREFAIMVDAEAGVAGKIGPNSIVDILATYAGTETKAPSAEVVIAGARIIDVGQMTVAGQNGVEGQQSQQQQSQQADFGAVVPVTFALTPREVNQLHYAGAFSNGVKLSLLRPGEQSELTARERKYTKP
jgi:pilus assembly protein CpaB